MLALALAVAPASASAANGGDVRGPVTRAGRWLVDDQGRVAVFHGFNVVRKLPPFVPTRFGKDDARLLAREGFTAARINFTWEAVEPQPGEYDDAYIAKILKFDSLLARYGIRTMVDFHQDLWSRSVGADGAPAWATLGADANQAFAAFWRNDPGPGGVGIQSRFLKAWRYVARRLRDHENIVALDPLNEPYPGSDYQDCGFFTRCPAFETGALVKFYRRVIRKIRIAGARQPIFPEGVADSGTKPPVLPKFSDPQTGFQFHFYCVQTSFTADVVLVGEPSAGTDTCRPIERRHIGYFTDHARKLNVPSWLGEFSCHDVGPDNAQTVDLVARTWTSWTSWLYDRPPTEPVDCANPTLLKDSTAPATTANVKQDKLDAMAVPYAEAIAGTPTKTRLDRKARTYRLSYRSTPVPGVKLRAGAVTAIFVPARMYPDGYRADVDGARVRSHPNARWLRLTAAPKARVSVRITPRN